ncbi:winged helix-turn-helix transcriptional regulator [Mesorhizobium silamurunense]|uniref:winged helix-turn-helix transcriptional regulator n=1 Tax=Mesorhizobium silamurunense TaxID=499528 RepID=UPI00177DBFC6|nr:helix-turn-helix domain-containing protein [Mesorhizobium silamurunense]
MSTPGTIEGTAPLQHVSPSVFCEHCPTRLVLDRLSDKWVVLVLARLSENPMRFNQLRRDIEGVAQKMLSQTLKKMERDGLIERRAFATVPVTVEYSITPLGLTLAKKIIEITHWAEENIGQVLAAQARYDAKQQAS